MSIQLSKNESILRSYDYATSHSGGLGATNGSKTLIVTNKRIIHRERIEGKKNAGVNTSEMPISAAKYVSTSFKQTRYPILMVIGIILAIVAVALFAALASVDMGVALIPLVIIGVIAAIFIIVYLKKKTYSFSCSINTDTRITNAFGFSSVSGDSRTRGIFAKFGKSNKDFYIKVKVNSEVAKQMAEELGSVISAAANGDFDAIEEELVKTEA